MTSEGNEVWEERYFPLLVASKNQLGWTRMNSLFSPKITSHWPHHRFTEKPSLIHQHSCPAGEDDSDGGQRAQSRQLEQMRARPRSVSLFATGNSRGPVLRSPRSFQAKTHSR